jgi:2,5-diamino-6-(ribosylamino)-4(3H)-pyrimidinone 5'-phosphate reductase
MEGAEVQRPHVHMNVAATADGKIDTFERRGAAISSTRDKERVDRLRADSDAVMIGGRTLQDEDPGLTVKSAALRAERKALGRQENPAKVAVASRLALKPACKFLTAGPARRLLFTTPRTEAAEISRLRLDGAEVFVQPGERVDLQQALATLKQDGIERLMVEGGATLNFELLRLGLVDELTVYVAPMVFGGENAPTLAGGGGLAGRLAIRLDLQRAEQWEDGGVLLHYVVRQA